MAYSSSITHASESKLCELCQMDSIKWRCIDCSKCLCEKCKIIHLNVTVTSQHHISIATPLQDVQTEIYLNNIPCKYHPKQMACLFCRSCDSLICPDCMSSSHEKHDFVSIELVLGQKLDNLRCIHDKISENLKGCESKTSEIQYMIAKHNAIFDGSLAKIKQKEHELIDSIRQHSKDLQVKVENERSKVNNILSKIKEGVDNTKKALEDQKEDIDAFLTTHEGSVIFKATMIIKDLKFDSFSNQVERFIPKKNSPKKSKKLFGFFQKESIIITRVPPEMDFEVVSTFTTNLPYIATVVTLDATSTWISCSYQKVLQKINIEDNNMMSSPRESLEVTDMALTSYNDLLFTLLGDSDVQLLKESGEIVSFIQVKPLLPLGIHVTKKNDVIVGVREPGNPFISSESAIIVYGMDGKMKQIYQYDNSEKRLFTIPRKITTNNNNDILVVDITSANTGRLVVLNEEGNIRWIYEGHYEINAAEKFVPAGIITTADYIIVSDLGSHAFHVLSADGEILACKVVRDMGIIGPYGLDIDSEGRLWLGCNESMNETGAKLHIIKLIP